ncbi:hypothetical protein Dform_00819 [Dehalogenimonas formicexedens]|uniref:Uncharacterized protein n=1 Tax=Dehalogenimonas formicexedens TaxID=1839801 RepID=A0A1P8F6Q3_9CHLR|nr:hypothetical protein [Dehalogenimonas formicexedens]APV44167.1 hypothetical protein Dform_00819 [Dehalogenimonas formicexedens]
MGTSQEEQPEPKPEPEYFLPGVKEAVELVVELSDVFAWNQLLEEAGKGEFGKKAKAYIENEELELDNLLKFKKVGVCFGDYQDTWLEELAGIAGPMIAQIWGLTESSGYALQIQIYWGDEPGELPFFFVFKKGIPEPPPDASVHTAMNENRLYLDVTDLSYKRFVRAYKTIADCRKSIGWTGKELLEGTHRHIDAEKALEMVESKIAGMKIKKIAADYQFKIYTSDNTAGSYPLARWYLKKGEGIYQKLVLLEGRIWEWYKNQMVKQQPERNS